MELIVKTRRHDCTRSHSTYRSLAICIYRSHHPEWIEGEGAYALIAWCRVLTIELHATLEAVEAAAAHINRFSCGGVCHQEHEVVRLLM